MPSMNLPNVEARGADACVPRLMEGGVPNMVVVVHVDDVFAIGKTSGCDQAGADLNKYVPSTTWEVELVCRVSIRSG